MKTIFKHQMNRGRACGLCCTKIQNFNVTRGKLEILKDINLHIHCGEITAIVGPNGAGKTTLLKSIMGLIKHSGKMSFLDSKDQHTNKPIVGYVPQYLNFDRGTPTSVLDLFLSNFTNSPLWLVKLQSDKDIIINTLKIVDAEHLINRKLGELSGGEFQRVLLSLAINPIPDLLLLDEPVSGIDEKGMMMFFDIVSALRKDYDMSIVLVSHDLEMVAKYADRVVLLNKTIECVGTPEEVYKNEKFFDFFGSVWSKGLFSNNEK
jgi:zinc transport system ATP-binding protein